MIRINLLQQRRSRRRGVSIPGPKPILLVLIFGAVVAAAVVFLVIHRPLANKVDELKTKNAEMTTDNAALKRDTKNSRSIRAAFESELARQQATGRLRKSRVTPAWLMFEITRILTPGQQPQITSTMEAEIKENPNRPWTEGWDPKNVWITSIKENMGKFEIHGGAQSKADVIELSLRLQASMFFESVSPDETEDVNDKESGITYHKFKLSGKLRY